MLIVSTHSWIFVASYVGIVHACSLHTPLLSLSKEVISHNYVNLIYIILDWTHLKDLYNTMLQAMAEWLEYKVSWLFTILFNMNTWTTHYKLLSAWLKHSVLVELNNH